MALFSLEEKNLIQNFALENALDGEVLEDIKKWQDIGKSINRNWEEVRNAYRQWRLEEQQINTVLKVENVQDDALILQNINNVCNEGAVNANNIYNGNEQNDNNETNDVVLMEILVPQGVFNENELQNYLAPLDWANSSNQIEQYMENQTEAACSMNNEDVVAGNKRKLDQLEEIERERLKIYEKMSREELELKSKESELKIKIYKMQLIQGQEIHNEKMKILRAKLETVQQQIHHIDSAICNKSLKKKFKSGPI